MKWRSRVRSNETQGEELAGASPSFRPNHSRLSRDSLGFDAIMPQCKAVSRVSLRQTIIDLCLQ